MTNPVQVEILGDVPLKVEVVERGGKYGLSMTMEELRQIGRNNYILGLMHGVIGGVILTAIVQWLTKTFL